MRRPQTCVALVFLVGSTAAIASGIACDRAAGGTQTQQGVYRDKNGYFSLLAPIAWTRRDYPEDPRSKVEFNHPAASGVRIRLIAALAPSHMNQANFVTLMRQDVDTMKARLASALNSIELEEGQFAGFTAAFVRASSVAGAQELTLFLAGNLFFNVSFEAPDVAALAVHRLSVQESLDTLLIKNPDPAGDEQIRAQRVARYLRLARLTAEAGQFDIARQSLEDGLQEYPTAPELLKALGAVKAGKVPR